MENKLITRCPITNEPLIVKKLYSKTANISIEGNFNLSKFNLLKDEHLFFVEVFIKNRGNIKMVEKELNISYPSVKKLLDETIISLGYDLSDSNTAEQSDDDIMKILEDVESNALSIKDALDKLSQKE